MVSGRKHGFTIVELLIVIVVIAILASVTVVAFSGVQRRAHNSSMSAEVDGWKKVLTMQYQESGWPTEFTSATADKYYCLGTGFPVGAGGVARCRTYMSTGSTSYIESDNASLMTKLELYGKVSQAPRKVLENTVGPWVMWRFATQTPEIWALFQDSCPANMTSAATANGTVWCRMVLVK